VRPTRYVQAKLQGDAETHTGNTSTYRELDVMAGLEGSQRLQEQQSTALTLIAENSESTARTDSITKTDR
jgi:hypothetical protein